MLIFVSYPLLLYCVCVLVVLHHNRMSQKWFGLYRQIELILQPLVSPQLAFYLWPRTSAHSTHYHC